MIIVSIVLLVGIVYIDQYTKKKAREELSDKKIEYEYMNLTLVKNNGAFRGLLKDHPTLLLGVQVVGVVFVVVLLVIQLFIKKDRLLVLGLSFLSAGAIGNLIDRMTNKYVTDFFAVKWTKNLYYNLADVFIFLGAIITFIRGKYL